MAHETEVVAYKKLSDGQFSVCVRCCGDEIHDSWHTVDATIMLDPVKYSASLDAHRDRVATNHEVAIQAEEIAKKLVGQKKAH